MKKLIILLVILISVNKVYSQKYYTYLGPSLSFETQLRDYKNLIGACFEAGKYLKKDVSIGFRTGLYSMDIKDIYSDFVFGAPVGNSNFSMTACVGYFPYYKDITMEYDINYNIPLEKNNSIVITYGVQSAFSTINHSFSVGLNKDF